MRRARRTWRSGTAIVVACALSLALPAGALATGEITEFPIPTAGSQPQDIITGGDGNLWFTEFQTPGIGRLTPAGTMREFIYSSSSSAPDELAVAQDGNVWFGDRTLHRVGRIKPLGAIRFFATPTTNSSVGGLAAGPDGNLWVSEGFTPTKIGRLGPGGLGGNPPVMTETTAPATIADVAAGIDGNMWFVESSNPAKIGRITIGGTVTEFPLGTPTSLPLRIAAGHDGNLWFTEFSGNRIGRVTTAGVINEFPLPAGITAPEGIAAGPDGNMWFAATQGIGRITPLGAITIFQAPGRPYGIEAGPDGYMWFTELTGNKIGRIATAVLPPTSGNLLLNPGFEQGTPVASNTVSGPTPGWITVPSFSPAAYGATGLAAVAVGTQIGGGANFGWGGTMSANIDRAWALQHVDVAREATGIDAGRATVTLSGLLGGLAAQEDNANVKAVFLSGSGDELSSVQIGPVTRDDRQSQTTLLPRSTAALVPAGTRAVRVVATSIRLNGGPSNDGFVDNLSLTLDVAPAPVTVDPPAGPGPGPGTLPPPGAPPGPGPTLVDKTAPVVDRFSVTPPSFAVGAGATPVAAAKRSAPLGTTVRYRLSEPAAVTFSFDRATAGRRAGSRCVKPTTRNRRAKPCTLYAGAGKLTRKAAVGVSSLKFSGRIGRKALAVGAYRITVLAKDAAGNKSSARQIAIKVVKR
jgi:streptogramin lyase